jgi:hypothetical protein
MIAYNAVVRRTAYIPSKLKRFDIFIWVSGEGATVCCHQL